MPFPTTPPPQMPCPHWMHFPIRPEATLECPPSPDASYLPYCEQCRQKDKTIRTINPPKKF